MPSHEGKVPFRGDLTLKIIRGKKKTWWQKCIQSIMRLYVKQ